MTDPRNQKGYALVAVLLLLALVTALLMAYFSLTSVESSTTGSSISSLRGFYAAEAGLNLRAAELRQVFEDYRVPSGVGPIIGGGTPPCGVGNAGSGDYACVQHALHQRLATTYVDETPGNPAAIVIPRGEPYQNLKAQEFRYSLGSVAEDPQGRTEAVLDMRIRSRLVPLFQFIAFYGKDLEILPGPVMQLSGPIHTNGDLYFDPDIQLDIHGQVTSSGEVYRGAKSNDSCQGSLLQVIDPGSLAALPNCSTGRALYSEADIAPWNGMVRRDVEAVSVPPPEALDPTPGELYWDRADLRIMLDLSGTPAIEVRNADGTTDGGATAILAGCSAAAHNNSFFNNREGATLEMLDIDVEELMNCINGSSLMAGGKQIDDGTDGGMVWYLGVDGPNSSTMNNYGVRVYNGAELASTESGAPTVQGLTVVTNQAMFVRGDYNATNKKPAAFLCDSINVLSNNWNDANSTAALSSRTAATTTINAAFLSGTDTTGGAEGVTGQDSGNYNGGLENYPRFHEDWSLRTLTYRGSFVSLNEPQHVDGAWVYGDPQYEAPTRDWDYDTDFDDVSKLPPLTPRFTYIRQDLLMRRFEL